MLHQAPPPVAPTLCPWLSQDAASSPTRLLEISAKGPLWASEWRREAASGRSSCGAPVWLMQSRWRWRGLLSGRQMPGRRAQPRTRAAPPRPWPSGAPGGQWGLQHACRGAAQISGFLSGGPAAAALRGFLVAGPSSLPPRRALRAACVPRTPPAGTPRASRTNRRPAGAPGSGPARVYFPFCPCQRKPSFTRIPCAACREPSLSFLPATRPGLPPLALAPLHCRQGQVTSGARAQENTLIYFKTIR